MYGSFTKLVHIARSTPPSLPFEGLHSFDLQVHQTFTECQAIDTSDCAWQQAQLRLIHGGIGLRSLAYHSPAAFIASVRMAGVASSLNCFPAEAVSFFNSLVPFEGYAHLEFRIVFSLSAAYSFFPARGHKVCSHLRYIQEMSLVSRSSPCISLAFCNTISRPGPKPKP